MTAQSEQTLVVRKIQTGIPGFDEISNGGIPQGRAALVAGSSGSGKTILAWQYLVNGITQYNEGGVFVTFEETPKDIRRNVKSFGWDLEKFENERKLAIVDVSPDIGQPAIETGNYDFSGLLVRIEHAIKKINAKRVCIDSISALLTQYANAGIVRRELFRIAAALKLMNVTTMITGERTQEYGEISRFGVEEFVADNVIIIRNSIMDEKRRRTIEILKFRGASHQKGEFPFIISNDGINVLPLSSMKLTMKSTDLRISSGCSELDEMCGGGFFQDSIVLASGATGTGKTLLVTTFMAQGCRQGERTMVFAFEESQAQLLRNAIGWGMNFSEWEKKGLLKIVCTYPEVHGLAEHLQRIKTEIEEFKPTRIAVDSLSALERISVRSDYREFVVILTSFIKEHQIAGLFTATTPSLMGGSSVTEQHISTITDSIILMRYVELMGEMRRGITVLKMRGSRHDKSIRDYTIDGSGIHIGKPFHNVGGILAGTPVQIISDEREKLGEMFEPDEPK